MIKKGLSVIYFVLSSICVKAQPALSDSSSNPIIGDQFVYNYSNYINPGSAGPNQTWDLSMLTTSGGITLNAVPPTNSQFYAGFQSSTVALTNGSSYDFYRADSTKLVFEGNGTQLSNQYVSHRYEKLLKYPFTYLDTSISNFSYQAYSNGIPVITTYGSGTDSLLADGYGTLILPNTTYPNTLRMQYTTREFTNSSIGQSDSIVIVEYRWYARNIHMPLAILTAYSDNGTTYYNGQYLSSSVNNTGVNKRPVLVVSPNPTQNHVRIYSSFAGKIIIQNALGECVCEYKDGGSLEINVEHFDNGVYFVSIWSGDELEVRKFIIQH